MNSITLRHYTRPGNLAGIYKAGQITPCVQDPPWQSGDKAVVWLTAGGCKWYCGTEPLVRVTVEVERSEVTFCADDLTSEVEKFLKDQ